MNLNGDDESIASIVLSASRVTAEHPAPFERALTRGSVASIILEASSKRRWKGTIGAWTFALGLHTGIVYFIQGSGSFDASLSVQAKSQPTLRMDTWIDLEPPPMEPDNEPRPQTETTSPEALESPRPPEPVKKTPSKPIKTWAKSPRATPDKAPEESVPAAAASVVAADKAPPEIIDFTQFDVATGEGKAFIGGATTSSGTRLHPSAKKGAARDQVGDTGGKTGSRPTSSRAQPVGPPERAWDCPWPRQADFLELDEQVVVLRARVRADGSVASTTLMTDPGHGFGEVATACTRRQRFHPAKDDSGRPIAATSPPIRVRFKRE